MDRLCARAGELALLGVPVFLFQEGDDSAVQAAFREIARLTKGAYCRFDRGSAKQLRELLTAVAVYAAGGRKALADLSGKRDGSSAARPAAGTASSTTNTATEASRFRMIDPPENKM